MCPRLDWSATGILAVIVVAAVVTTAWQVRVDRSVFEDYFGSADPIAVVTGAALAGVVALAFLQGASSFAVAGPGGASDAISVIARTVPLLVLVAIGADLILRFDEDTNVALPDALRFYPAIAVFVELMLHAVPIAALVAILGAPTGLDATFWRIAVPIAVIEAVLQTVYAASVGTAVFSALHLTVFGVVQVWMFWRFGFVWMLGFRLAYYALWHVLWGAARLELLF
jgi:hypothetical protein